MIGWIMAARLSEEGDPLTPNVSTKAFINLAVLALSVAFLSFLPTIQHPTHNYCAQFLTRPAHSTTSDSSKFNFKPISKMTGGKSGGKASGSKNAQS
jgi:hypothetical protein